MSGRLFVLRICINASNFFHLIYFLRHKQSQRNKWDLHIHQLNVTNSPNKMSPNLRGVKLEKKKKKVICRPGVGAPCIKDEAARPANQFVGSTKCETEVNSDHHYRLPIRKLLCSLWSLQELGTPRLFCLPISSAHSLREQNWVWSGSGRGVDMRQCQNTALETSLEWLSCQVNAFLL